MAYSNIELFVYCPTRSAFEAMVSSGEVTTSQIGIIAESGEFWENGNYHPLVLLTDYLKKDDAVSFAKDLTGTIEATAEEFTFRPSAGDKSIRDESAVIRRIKGNTSVWGQLLGEMTADNWNQYSNTYTNIEYLENGCKSTILSAYAGGNVYQLGLRYKPTVTHYVSGHKYMVIFDAYVEVSGQMSVEANDTTYYSPVITAGQWVTTFVTFTRNGTVNNFYVKPPKGYQTTASVGKTYSVRNAMLFDLTALYESGNEPTTLEEFKKLYPESYYPYCEPEVRSMRATGIETIGANAFNKDSVVGGLINADGTVTSNDIYSVAKIEVVHNEKYTLTNVANAAYTTYTYALYDSNDRFISVGEIKNLVTKLVSVSGDVTMPLNARYIRVVVHNDYLDSCCVNLKHSGTLTSEEATYFKEVRMLPDIATYFPDGMHSIGGVFDEINEESAVKRFGVRAYEDGDNDNADVITDGTNTVYILEEPIITPIVEPLQLDYKVADFGTEKMLHDLPSSPFRADIVYQFNAADRIRDNARNIERLEEHTKDMATMDYVIEKIPTAIATATERVTTWPSDNRLVANVLVDVSNMSQGTAACSILGFVGGSSDYSFDDVWRIRFAGNSSALNILPTIYWVNGQAPSFDTWAICDIEFRRTPIGFIFGEWKIYR